MNVYIDKNKFDELQIELISAIAHEVHAALKLAGAPSDKNLEDIVTSTHLISAAVWMAAKSLKQTMGHSNRF